MGMIDVCKNSSGVWMAEDKVPAKYEALAIYHFCCSTESVDLHPQMKDGVVPNPNLAGVDLQQSSQVWWEAGTTVQDRSAGS